jgi:outer membrane protein assembly factor BamB
MLDALIFTGFNSRVAALNRDTGETVWTWRSPKGSGYTTVLLDGDLLIVSVEGYTYALDSVTGQQVWFNDLPGMGSGVATLASLRGIAGNPGAQSAADEEERRRRSASS